MNLLSHLLPEPTHLRLESCLLDEAQTQLTLRVISLQAVVSCPICTFPARRVHSHYHRTLADLPWADHGVTLQLQVRKFFCHNAGCKRRIFTERIVGVAAPWARRTQRLVQRLTAVGLALGGAAGVRLSQHLGLSVSRNTLLTFVKRLPLPQITPPRILGVDDFSWRKHHTYGSVLIDLEHSRPVALLKDREAETLADWLQEHPGVEVVSRDRSKSYEKGVLQGAPQALQVADRFHLLQNLAETLDQVFNAHSKALKAVEVQQAEGFVTRGPFTLAHQAQAAIVPIALPASSLQEHQRIQQRRSQRLSIYQQVWQLHQQGLSASAIARQVGIGRTSVFRYLRTPVFPERQGRSDRGRSVLSPYKKYILKRWNAGYYNTKGLFEDIQQQGYRGSYDTVARYTRRLRSSQGLRLRQRLVRQPLPKVAEPERRPLTARRATLLVLQSPENQHLEDKQVLTHLKAQHPELLTAIDLTRDFAQLVRQRLPQHLDPWLELAIASGLAPFRRFAQRLREDYAAVKAGVTLPWSNGPTEGHINRLKMLKRQMFGRAGLELLSRRFLLPH